MDCALARAPFYYVCLQYLLVRCSPIAGASKHHKSHTETILRKRNKDTAALQPLKNRNRNRNFHHCLALEPVSRRCPLRSLSIHRPAITMGLVKSGTPTIPTKPRETWPGRRNQTGEMEERRKQSPPPPPPPFQKKKTNRRNPASHPGPNARENNNRSSHTLKEEKSKLLKNRRCCLHSRASLHAFRPPAVRHSHYRRHHRWGRCQQPFSASSFVAAGYV